MKSKQNSIWKIEWNQMVELWQNEHGQPIDSLEEPGGGWEAREGSGADDQGKRRWGYHGFS